MNKVSVLVADHVDESGLERLRSAGFTVSYKPGIKHDELVRTISNYEVLIVRGRTKVTREVIENGRRLRVIGRAGVGLDNIDLEAAREKGVLVLNSPEALTEPVAELTIGLMIAVARGIVYGHEELSKGRWVKNEVIGIELMGRTLGILGFGRIGRRVGELAKSFGMKILVNDIITPPKELLDKLGARLVSLEELFMNSEFVTIHVPLTNETRGMVDYNLLGLMKPGSYLINTSRGPVVKQEDLVKALREGILAGAALDVYDQEPPSPSLELLRMPNVVHTPHIGGQTREAQARAIMDLADKIIKAIKRG